MQINAPELYELTGPYAEICAALAEFQTDKDYEELLRQYDLLEADIASGGESEARLLRNTQEICDVLAALIKTFESQADRLRARLKSTKAFERRIRERIAFAMEIAGMQRLRTNIGTWYIVEDVHVDVTDAEAVPAEFIRRVTPEADKASLKRHIKATGEIIPGVNATITREARFR